MDKHSVCMFGAPTDHGWWMRGRNYFIRVGDFWGVDVFESDAGGEAVKLLPQRTPSAPRNTF